MQSITWREEFKFLFDFLNFQTRQTNGSFKSCNSHINACRDRNQMPLQLIGLWDADLRPTARALETTRQLKVPAS